MSRIRARGESFLEQPQRLTGQSLEPQQPPRMQPPAPMSWSAPLPDHGPDPEERGTVVERLDMDEEAPTVMEDVPGHLLADESYNDPPPPPPVSLPRSTPSLPPVGSSRAPSRPPDAYRLNTPTPPPVAPGPRPGPYSTPPHGYSAPPPSYSTPPHGYGPHGTNPPPYASTDPRAASVSPSGIGAASPAAERAGLPARAGGAPPGKRRRGCLRRLLALGVLAVVGGALAAGGGLWYFSQGLPTLETLAHYRPPTVTIVKDRDGQVLGEIYEQRRYVVDYELIPEHTRYAFVAAEDANFFNHVGVDPLGILRAAINNIKQQKMAQGASTITQQVARNFLLSSEKKLARKIREAILATRIEEAFPKERILYLYLNQIYLGSGAYGVEAAARIYFDKHVEDLTLGESAILAGLPQRPSDYSPHRHWDKAKSRQTYVLHQMVEKGFITQADADAALKEEIKVVKTENPIRVLAPYFTEHVRRHLVETYGFDRVYNEGLVATTTCDLDLQQVAQESVTRQVTEFDKQLGWRGPIEALGDSDAAIKSRRDAQETAMREQDQFLADNARRGPLPERSTLREGELFEAVVLSVEKKHAIVGVGSHEGMIPLSWTKWGFEPDTKRSWRYRANEDLTNTLKKGDVVTVKVEALKAEDTKSLSGYEPAEGKGYAGVSLQQAPALQGAYLSMDLDTGAVLSMVGGIDIEESEFNRAVQAKRQVGSTFKPIVYSTAINEKLFTPGSIVLDAPVTYNTLEEKLWKPGNYGEEYLGNITLRKALALSRNVCTVRVLDVVGLDAVYDMARNLGIESHLEKDLSMGLGSSSITMIEMVRAYSAFATYGDRVEPYFIERVEDRDGNVLEQHKLVAPKPVLDPTVAGITTWLLREVATSGTAAATNRLGIHAAGKTGTTNDFKDAWFVGFTPDLIGAAWVGYDQPRSMGVSSTGGRVALPIWMDWMEVAYPKEKDRPFEEIPGAVWAAIDESTGRVAKGGRGMPFVPGTVPENVAAEVGQVTADELKTLEF
ncbi:MAG: PBP1A family penicillin-binding protein [Alphaproteobacteria bacterium]|nr:PBP1A family penicillin-binding protein [Alphaproteobacteria bacterium]